MRSYILDLSISADDFRLYYSGQIKYVVARARSGETVQFAARHLRPFITRDGIRGGFRITTDEHNQFVSLERL